jgi:hypothetical protein
MALVGLLSVFCALLHHRRLETREFLVTLCGQRKLELKEGCKARAPDAMCVPTAGGLAH